MGGGNDNSNNGQGSFDDDEDDGANDALAMLGVLATIKDGAGGAWGAYNEALGDKPILVKVGRGETLPVAVLIESILFQLDQLVSQTCTPRRKSLGLLHQFARPSQQSARNNTWPTQQFMRAVGHAPAGSRRQDQRRRLQEESSWGQNCVCLCPPAGTYRKYSGQDTGYGWIAVRSLPQGSSSSAQKIWYEN